VQYKTGLQLLNHAEAVADRIVVNFQLEAEFKKNRQAAILDGMQELKSPQEVSRLGIFSDAKATRVMQRSMKEVEKRAKTLKSRLGRALANPAVHDPVYKVCQRIFHKEDDLNLTRGNVLRHTIRRKALRRFFQGYPPRKKNDTSIGDAFNWEWMVHCATQRKAGLVIVTRDFDYGLALEGKSYINDHLRQEFSERVSRKRKLLLYSRLSDALKLFQVAVSPQEEEVETELVSSSLAQRVGTSLSAPEVAGLFQKLGSTMEFYDNSKLRTMVENMKSPTTIGSSEMIKSALAATAAWGDIQTKWAETLKNAMLAEPSFAEIGAASFRTAL
jgi:hypothetical protein